MSAHETVPEQGHGAVDNAQAPYADLGETVNTCLAATEEAYADVTRRVDALLENVLSIQAAEVVARANATALAEIQEENAALRRALKERETAVAKAQNEIAELKENVAKLYTELQNLRETNELAPCARPSGSEDVAAIEAELAIAREQLAAARLLTDKVDELKNALAEERRRTETLTDTIAELQADESSAADFEKELALFRQERDEAMLMVQQLEAERDALQQANASLAAPAPMAAPESGGSLSLDAEGSKRRLGEILVAAGIVDKRQLEAALTHQTGSPHKRLGEILVEMGMTNEDIVARVLARQLGLPFMALAEAEIDPSAPSAMTGQLAQRRGCMPVQVGTDHLVLAMVNPLDLVTIDDVERTTGKQVAPVVVSASDLAVAQTQWYGTI